MHCSIHLSAYRSIKFMVHTNVLTKRKRFVFRFEATTNRQVGVCKLIRIHLCAAKRVYDTAGLSSLHGRHRRSSVTYFIISHPFFSGRAVRRGTFGYAKAI